MPDNAIARLLSLGGELTTRRKFDPAHMRTLLRALGDPHLRFPSVLIAGTNGKGSTAATLASILQAGGNRTSLYTSPHLEAPNERIRVNGEDISDQALSELFLQVEEAAAELVRAGELPQAPSFFEAVTAIAFLHFAATLSGGGIAVLEVGLGGRLDATNVVEPLLCVLTDISLDHQEWLGSTIAAITREKCGILRPHGTLVTLPQHPEANQTIGEVAVPLGVEAINATDYLPPRSLDAPSGTLRDLRNRYAIPLPPGVLDGGLLQVDSPLTGEHQRRNLALAIAASVYLCRQGCIRLTREAVEAGIRQTIWPGRLQLLHPVGKPAILLDAAHNPAGAWALRAFLSSLPQTGSRTLVFGCMAEKAVDELAQILFPVFDTVALTRTGWPRAASLERLSSAADRTGTSYRTYESAAEALRSALINTPASGLVVLAGSILLLGECLQSLAQPSE